MGFSDLLGNEDLKKRILASVRAGKHSHCYLITGPEGSGKRTLAKLMAQAMQCGEQNTPCGRCNPCRKVENNIHPDVITVDDPEKKTVQVELIRDLQADAFVRPNEGRRKIYLIPRGQDMTDSAQNALLKLIEEPPSYAVFLILTTNSDRLLPTVRSRSVELRLEPVPWQTALPALRAFKPEADEQTLQAAWLRGGGFLGQVRQLLESGEELPQTVQFIQAFAERDDYGLTKLFCSMEKLPRDQMIACLTRWKQLLTQALAVRSGVPAGPEATLLGQRRTARDLAAAAAAVQQALEWSSAYIGTGHICGWLTVNL